MSGFSFGKPPYECKCEINVIESAEKIDSMGLKQCIGCQKDLRKIFETNKVVFAEYDKKKYVTFKGKLYDSASSDLPDYVNYFFGVKPPPKVESNFSF